MSTRHERPRRIPPLARPTLRGAPGRDRIVVMPDPLTTRVAGLVPRQRLLEPIKPGTLVEPVRVQAKQLEQLVRDSVATEPRVVWSQGSADVLVLLDRTRVRLLDGFVLVAFTLQTTQFKTQQLTVPLAVGSAQREAGLITATSRLPEGHTELGRRWGDSVIALAFGGLFAVAEALAAAAGRDSNGESLLPAALRATPKEFVVIPRAPFVAAGAKTKRR